MAGAKSDHADAVVLAGILRTDAATHRPLPADSELVQAIAVLARAQQDAVWSRQQLAMKLRWLLREFFPAALAAFHPKARRPDRPRGPRRAGRRANPHPGGQSDHRTAAPPAALRWSPAQPRRLDQAAAASFRADQPRQLPLVEQAMGQQVLALLAQLQAACQAADDPWPRPPSRSIGRHPDYQIITSFPGLGELTGARVLAELGDDRSRFTDARGVKAYAGAAPVTRASGKRLQVLARKVKNQRLAAVGYLWAFAA